MAFVHSCFLGLSAGVMQQQIGVLSHGDATCTGHVLKKIKKKNSRASIQNFKPAWSDLAFVLDLVIYSLTVFFKPGFLKIWTNISKRPPN